LLKVGVIVVLPPTAMVPEAAVRDVATGSAMAVMDLVPRVEVPAALVTRHLSVKVPTVPTV
jgi:hypothetical protein